MGVEGTSLRTEEGCDDAMVIEIKSLLPVEAQAFLQGAETEARLTIIFEAAIYMQQLIVSRKFYTVC